MAGKIPRKEVHCTKLTNVFFELFFILEDTLTTLLNYIDRKLIAETQLAIISL